MSALAPDIIEVVLDLPMPPTTNNLFAGTGRKRVKTLVYRAWEYRAGWELLRQRPPRIKGPVAVTIEVSEADSSDNRDALAIPIRLRGGVRVGEGAVRDKSIHLPSRMDGEIVARLVGVIKSRIPQADERPAESVLDEQRPTLAVASFHRRRQPWLKPLFHPGLALIAEVHLAVGAAHLAKAHRSGPRTTEGRRVRRSGRVHRGGAG